MTSRCSLNILSRMPSLRTWCPRSRYSHTEPRIPPIVAHKLVLLVDEYHCKRRIAAKKVEDEINHSFEFRYGVDIGPLYENARFCRRSSQSCLKISSRIFSLLWLRSDDKNEHSRLQQVPGYRRHNEIRRNDWPRPPNFWQRYITCHGIRQRAKPAYAPQSGGIRGSVWEIPGSRQKVLSDGIRERMFNKHLDVNVIRQFVFGGVPDLIHQ